MTKKHLFFLVLWLYSWNLMADEGMWLISLTKDLIYNDMKKMGLRLTPEQIYSVNHSSVKDAVVIFNGYCTGEMVSPEGLLFTNHHCGMDAIQSHSTVEHDYLKEGFWAASRKDELPNPGMFVSFLVRIEDVSPRVLSHVNDTMKESERRAHVAAAIDEIIRAATDSTFYNAEVKAMDEGNAYFLFVYETYKDIRLVGAPPQSIGKFGGETDNWMWPRHTGDFSIFRVYCSPDGKPAEYSPENVPLKPRHFFPISMKGIREGDFTMVIGYPGTTDRYATSYAIKELAEVVHPIRINVRGLRQSILMEEMQKDEKIRIQYASKYARSSNYWKYSIGQMKGIRQQQLIEKKQQEEQQFARWYNADSARKAKYGNVLPTLDRAFSSRKELYSALMFLSEAVFRSIESISFALSFNDLYEELSKKNPDPENVNGEIQYLKKSAGQFFKNYNRHVDMRVAKAMFSAMMTRMKDPFRPSYCSFIEKKYHANPDKFVNEIYKQSMFCDSQRLMTFLENPSLKILKKDKIFQVAMATHEKYTSMQRENNMINLIISGEKRKYIRGRQEMEPGKKYYPDANFTMRLSYGKTGGYRPADGVKYDYVTTLTGVMEKENPLTEEFYVPGKLKDLYRQKDFYPYSKDSVLTVCFISDNDITGGNSGSPVLNAEGELTGIAFDGNWESMTVDIHYHPQLQKCISVDIRYVLFIIDKYAEARYLLNELVDPY